MTECYRCGQEGHTRANCPQDAPLPASTPSGRNDNGKPPWCGQCDPRTRLVDHGDYMTRCAWCHPAGSKTLAQHRRCGGCGELIYTWDALPCTKHQPLFISPGGRRAAITRKDRP
jgi:Zinc knuckle